MPNGISILLQPDSMQVRVPSEVSNKFQGHIKGFLLTCTTFPDGKLSCQREHNKRLMSKWTRKNIITDLCIVRKFLKKALKLDKVAWGDMGILRSST